MFFRFKLTAFLCCLTAIPAAAQVTSLQVEENITVGEDATKAIDTNLNGWAVPADIGQIFIGNTAQSADAITIDSGSNFPPGIAFRRYLGDAMTPQVVTPGTQLGYLDFRGYSGGQFFNAGSLDVVVDGAVRFADGELPPTQMRFAVSNGETVYIPMELKANGRLELGALAGNGYFGPGALGDPKLFVNTNENKWATIFAARPTDGPAFALRLHTSGETASDYIIGGSSGEGTGSFKFSVRGNGDVHMAGDLMVRGRNVLGELSSTREDVDSMQASIAVHETRLTDVEVVQAQQQTELRSLAFGTDGAAVANGENSLAIGPGAVVTGVKSVAVGSGARANGASAIAQGDNALASGPGNIAIGPNSVATAAGTLAVGSNARAIRNNAVAIGNTNLAEGVQAVAVGNGTVALGDQATALGSGASARHVNATAVGAGATTTAANQVMLGDTGTSVVVADIAASTAAQSGPVDVVTVDANGTLGRSQVASQSSVDAVRVSMKEIAAVNESQLSELSGRVSTLNGQVTSLFDRTNTIERDAKQGIAAVAAMAHPNFPSAAGKTSYASNVAAYRGEVGFSAGAMRRFEGDFAVSASVTFAGGDSAAVRLGVAGEF